MESTERQSSGDSEGELEESHVSGDPSHLEPCLRWSLVSHQDQGLAGRGFDCV